MQDNPAYARETITVGAADADLIGTDGAAVQRALDTLAGAGGGTVLLKDGTYTLDDSIRLRTDVALVGRGDAVVLRRRGLVASRLLADVDIGEFHFSPAESSLFRPGMGIRIWDSVTGWAPSCPFPLTVGAVQNGRVLLSDMNTHNRLAANGAKAVNHFEMILGLEARRAMVESITLDGTGDDSEELKGLRAPLFYLHRSPQCTIRCVRALDGCGDGICFGKASTHAVVEDCETARNGYHGIHPGSHSNRCAVRRCHIHHNGSDGLYICWGIHHSVFEDNHVHDNGARLWRSGISIGHKDTDNVLARNRVHDNCKYGICIRRKTEANGAHRNVFLGNVIENNCANPDLIPPDLRWIVDEERLGCAVNVQGVTRDVVFERNVIRDTRPDGERFQRDAFYLADGVSGLRLTENEISVEGEAVVDESGAGDSVLS